MFKVAVLQISEAEDLSGEELYSLLFQPEPCPDYSWMDRPRPKNKIGKRYLAWLKKEDGGQDQDEELEGIGWRKRPRLRASGSERRDLEKPDGRDF